MANLLSELERFEEEMKDLGSEPSSSLLPPAHLVARVSLPPPPPPPRLTPSLTSSTAVPLLPNSNGIGPAVGTHTRPLPPAVVTPSIRALPLRSPPNLATASANLPPPPPVASQVGTATSWLNPGSTATASRVSVSSAPPVSQFTYSQPPTSLTSASGVPPTVQPTVSAPSSSYFPVPFHLQQQPQSYQQTHQYQPQSYQQGPVQYSLSSQPQAKPQTSQGLAVPALVQPNYQYQAGYQALAESTAAPATPTSEIFAMPQQQQAQQLFQRDAQTITPEALESVKAALASGEGEHKSEARKRAIPRKAAGLNWEDPTLADWPENDHRLFCGDLGNEVNDEVLTKAFTRFATFNMARVVRDKRTGKTKGYGFVSFANPSDLALAFKEMNGKYVGNRPIKLRKSTWKERTDQEAFEKHKNSKRQKSKKSLLHK